MNEADDVLARRARGGDRPAFEELVRRTSRSVFARLYLETGDAHRAEDLLQETFLIAFRSVRRLKEPAGFRAWLMRIAANVAIDAARRDRRRKRARPQVESSALDALPGTGDRPDERAQGEESRRRVLGVLRSLPEEYRLPLTLRYLGGSDYETIQTQLGLTNGSLRGLLHRGLKLLRERCGDLGVEGNG
jgi:RNA polymerase sigma-70 factor (ECF subfamily)